MVVSYLYFACTHLRVAVFSCLEYVYKKEVCFHTKTIPPLMHFLISFYSAVVFSVEPELPACCDLNTPIIKDMQPFSQAAFFTGT